MSEGQIRSSRAGTSKHILVLTLERPKKANAYTSGMLRSLGAALEEARTDSTIRAAIITGTGAVFSAGADLDELGAKDPAEAMSLLSRNVFDAWSEAPWPTIAAVNGPALGGGFELALACDVRICAPSAFFQLPETKLGLLPAAGGIRRLAVELGAARLKEIVLFGKKVDAPTARTWGLVADVENDPLASAIALAEPCASIDPTAVRAAKMLIEERMQTLRGRGAEGLAQAFFYARRATSEART